MELWQVVIKQQIIRRLYLKLLCTDCQPTGRYCAFVYDDVLQDDETYKYSNKKRCSCLCYTFLSRRLNQIIDKIKRDSFKRSYTVRGWIIAFSIRHQCQTFHPRACSGLHTSQSVLDNDTVPRRHF